MAKKFNFMKTAVDGLAVGGGFVLGKTANKLPFIKDQSNLIRAGAKVVLGAIAPMVIKNDIVEKVGLGLLGCGLQEAVTEFIPSIAGIPYAKPMMLNRGMGALEDDAALGALEDNAALGKIGRAIL